MSIVLSAAMSLVRNLRLPLAGFSCCYFNLLRKVFGGDNVSRADILRGAVNSAAPCSNFGYGRQSRVGTKFDFETNHTR